MVSCADQENFLGGGGPNSQKGTGGKFQHDKKIIIWQFQGVGGMGSGPPVPPSGSAHGYCQSGVSPVNYSDSEAAVFPVGVPLPNVILSEKYYNEQSIDIVSFYKYLGVYFTPKLIWTKTKEVLAHQAAKLWKFMLYRKAKPNDKC